ncbi:MAG TPA: GNAT family protein [Lactovum miscens]|uniref:GNAT family N-acetyltransferase n=1 Tax=Lactovum miscens TaxID=190387 RepID=UPI002ED7CAD8
MFTLTQFKIGNDIVKLDLPENSHVKSLYEIINNDYLSLKRWLPWVDEIHSIEDERKFIEMARKDTALNKTIVSTILINGKAVGIIDLHNINRKNMRAEIGYWISRDIQGHGIVTESVKRFIEIVFKELNLNKLTIIAESENSKSRAVAERLNFEYEATLKEHLIYNNEFKDYIVYSKFSNR